MVADLGIGELARRSGVAPSALRFYEEKGLISSQRTAGNQRRYERSVLRRIALIRVAQSVGLTLEAIAAEFTSLPEDRTPSRSDWESLSRRWRGDLEDRIARLESLRDDLTGCIGCGCLSLSTCRLLNPGDAAGRKGPGPRYWLGDDPG